MASPETSVVVRDPAVLSGEPVFRGTRVPVKTLFEYLGAGDSLDEFLDGFPSVTRELALGAIAPTPGQGIAIRPE